MDRTFLILTDFSTCAERAFPFAREHLKTIGAKGILLAVFEDNYPNNIAFGFGLSPIATAGLYDEFSGRAHSRLSEVIDKEFQGLPIVGQVLRNNSDSVAKEVVQFATKHNVEGIILATHGRTGLKRFVLGSVAEEVIRETPCPVYVIPALDQALHEAASFATRTSLVLLTDFSPESEVAFRYAQNEFEALKHLNPQLTLLHVVEDIFAASYHARLGSDAADVWEDLENQAQQQIDALKAKYFPSALVMTAVIRQSGPIAEEIASYARSRNARLIILATHGRRGLQHAMLGSVAERTLRISECPVMVVPIK